MICRWHAQRILNSTPLLPATPRVLPSQPSRCYLRWKSSGRPEDAVLEMTYYAPLANYLEDGLEVLAQHKIDVNKVPWKRAKARKR